jgi:hypothetical protein
MPAQHCPICSNPVPESPRYRRYLCPSCAARATTADGRRLVFSNAGPLGGFVAVHEDDGSAYDRHECFVDGRPCHADEARFGGIVIEAKPVPPGIAG